MNRDRITRRGLVLGSLALLSGCSTLSWPISSANKTYTYISPQYRRKHVRYEGYEPPGTIVVNTYERYLYLVEDGGWATRYGVAVGEEGLTFKGEATVGRKAEWPTWTPTKSMIERKPHLAQYAGGVEGGPHNPLGASALYLYQNGKDTMFRVHGTNEPWSIGHAVSNGCVRLTNENIVDLYNRVPLGTRVVII
ncbi:L,D-transpeptidase [Rhizobiaceae bacterium n13]|uniref:L,D-transpeptidase n=1 Tax=Ferirhizobium litorale TaxID=2927786 RepID=A0AAE3QF47_9HYPH|nr:L,D-transpeptidase [Fererhizobium litorale]MDI7864424.1 L,D-transpeptidase [Fererhizobium litorale]MDI7924662.1 L,D-transpeptidase [Fererhizobium litorale]